MDSFYSKMLFLNTPAWVFQLTDWMPLVKMICLIVPSILSILVYVRNGKNKRKDEKK